MLGYVLSSGTYGTEEHRIANGVRASGGSKLRYLWNRFRVPFSKKDPRYDAYARLYPVFYRYRILLTLLPFYRLIVRRKKAASELRSVRKA